MVSLRLCIGDGSPLPLALQVFVDLNRDDADSHQEDNTKDDDNASFLLGPIPLGEVASGGASGQGTGGDGVYGGHVYDDYFFFSREEGRALRMLLWLLSWRVGALSVCCRHVITQNTHDDASTQWIATTRK